MLEAEKELQDVEIHFLKHVVKMLYFILTFGQHIKKFSQGRHFSVGKDGGKTSHIERFNLTFRQHINEKSYRSNLDFISSL